MSHDILLLVYKTTWHEISIHYCTATFIAWNIYSWWPIQIHFSIEWNVMAKLQDYLLWKVWSWVKKQERSILINECKLKDKNKFKMFMISRGIVVTQLSQCARQNAGMCYVEKFHHLCLSWSFGSSWRLWWKCRPDNESTRRYGAAVRCNPAW